jgi:hypothetical protein
MIKKAFAITAVLIAYLTASAQDLKTLLKIIPDTKNNSPVEIMFLGSSHFGQDSYKNAKAGDLFSAKRQQEVAEVNRLLLKFQPDMVMIERTPEEQTTTDSLYTLFRTGKVSLNELPNGRGESFQIGYNIAKQSGHNRIFGVDYYESVSNRILTEGQNIEYFQKALTEFAGIGRIADSSFKEGNITVKEFLQFLNTPKVLELAYRFMFITPARVQNGRFLNPPAQYVDTSCINPQYIGAEYISIFQERELKIYSNIVTTQLQQKGKRVLVIMGHRHAAVLPKIFENDPAYKIVSVTNYLK